MSFDAALSIGGVFAADEDVLRWDGASFSLSFDGSGEGVPPGLDVDGLHYDTVADDWLLSFDSASQIDGVSFGREDVLRFDPNTGSWSLALDASMTDPGLAMSNLVAVPEPGGLLVFASGVLLRERRHRALGRDALVQQPADLGQLAVQAREHERALVALSLIHI